LTREEMIKYTAPVRIGRATVIPGDLVFGDRTTAAACTIRR
jgi:regulator of RNase E activity RraA